MAKNPAKLFVGGLSRNIDEDFLALHFSKYGQVKETLIIMDKFTGQSRGFGFVIFEEQSAADLALQDQHIILKRKVDVKWAIPEKRYSDSNGKENDNESEMELGTKKIFVGGLPHNTTDEEFKDFFEAFGRVIDSIIIRNEVTGKSRGFGFVTFNSEDSMAIVLQNKYHKFKGSQIEVKKAKPKSKNDDQDKYKGSHYHPHNRNWYIAAPAVSYYYYRSQIPSLYSIYSVHDQSLLYSHPYMNGDI